MRAVLGLGLSAWLGLCAGAQSLGSDELKRRIQAALEQHDVPAAGRMAAEGIQRFPGDPVFLHLRGTAYFQLQRLDLAQADLEAAQKLSPTDPDLAFDFGLLLMARHQYEPAARQFERALTDADRRKTALPHIMLGRAYQNSNRSELAIEQFLAALRLEPAVKLGHYHLGYAYESIGRNGEAIAEYQKELARSADVPDVHYQLGHVLLEGGAPAKAIAAFRKALALDPRHGDAQYELGKALLAMGDARAAVTELHKAESLTPDAPSVYFQLARAYSQIKNRDAAARALARFEALKKAQQPTSGMATGRIR